MKAIALISLLIVLAATAWAQTSRAGLETPIKIAKPNFSGRWQLNLAKSKFEKNSPPGLAALFHLVVEHTEPQISVLIAHPENTAPSPKSAAASFTWFTDGRGNKFDPTFENAYTTTKWVDQKLVTNHYDSDERTKIVQFEEIELGADGKTLKILVKQHEFRTSERTEKDIGYTKTDHLVFDRVR
jgi:hypothetical protein